MIVGTPVTTTSKRRLYVRPPPVSVYDNEPLVKRRMIPVTTQHTRTTREAGTIGRSSSRYDCQVGPLEQTRSSSNRLQGPTCPSPSSFARILVRPKKTVCTRTRTATTFRRRHHRSSGGGSGDSPTIATTTPLTGGGAGRRCRRVSTASPPARPPPPLKKPPTTPDPNRHDLRHHPRRTTTTTTTTAEEKEADKSSSSNNRDKATETEGDKPDSDWMALMDNGSRIRLLSHQEKVLNDLLHQHQYKSLFLSVPDHVRDRQTLVGWLLEIGHNLELDRDTVESAVDVMDRFLAVSFDHLHHRLSHQSPVELGDTLVMHSSLLRPLSQTIWNYAFDRPEQGRAHGLGHHNYQLIAIAALWISTHWRSSASRLTLQACVESTEHLISTDDMLDMIQLLGVRLGFAPAVVTRLYHLAHSELDGPLSDGFALPPSTFSSSSSSVSISSSSVSVSASSVLSSSVSSLSAPVSLFLASQELELHHPPSTTSKSHHDGSKSNTHHRDHKQVRPTQEWKPPVKDKTIPFLAITPFRWLHLYLSRARLLDTLCLKRSAAGSLHPAPTTTSACCGSTGTTFPSTSFSSTDEPGQAQPILTMDECLQSPFVIVAENSSASSAAMRLARATAGTRATRATRAMRVTTAATTTTTTSTTTTTGGGRLPTDIYRFQYMSMLIDLLTLLPVPYFAVYHSALAAAVLYVVCPQYFMLTHGLESVTGYSLSHLASLIDYLQIQVLQAFPPNLLVPHYLDAYFASFLTDQPHRFHPSSCIVLSVRSPQKLLEQLHERSGELVDDRTDHEENDGWLQLEDDDVSDSCSSLSAPLTPEHSHTSPCFHSTPPAPPVPCSSTTTKGVTTTTMTTLLANSSPPSSPPLVSTLERPGRGLTFAPFQLQITHPQLESIARALFTHYL